MRTTISPTDTWTQLATWMATLDDLSATSRLLQWDRETLMPEAAATGRGRQVATLSAMRHRHVLMDGIDDVIERASADPDLSDGQRAVVHLARRERRRAERIPEDLVREMSEATSDSVTSWAENLRSGSFVQFAPALRRVVEAARLWGEALDVGDEPYDGLLDDHEPGMSTAVLEPLFGRLTDSLSGLLSGIADSDGDRPFAGRTWEDAAQFELAHDVARMVGFDLDRGVIGRSAHPFTTSTQSTDVRFTTRISTADPTINILVTLHEGGHALYSQGHPVEWERTLVHPSPSLGAEESQSRFYENHLGRSLPMWERLEPMLRERFPTQMDGIDAAALHKAVTGVHRGWCRVDADELTYDLHIALRFQMELALIRGDLDVDDIPQAWSEGMQRLLGVTPASDREGCMQDIHWAWGSFGYFPTYTLGNIYAAQIHEAMERDLGPIGDLVASDAIGEITTYLRERIHRQGSLYPTAETMERATGASFSIDPYLRRATALAQAAR